MYADWTKAPEWAMWHAIDMNGNGHWYDDEPILIGEPEFKISSDSQFEFNTTFLVGSFKNWKNTLEQRPSKPSYKEQINAVLDQQLSKGKNKYGVTLEDGTLDIEATLDHALQEIGDLFYYLVHVKNLMQKEKSNE